MEQLSIIGIDLTKHSFQLHGAQADGSVAFRKKAEPGQVTRLPRLVAALCGGHGGLRERSLLGPRVREARLRGVRLVPANLRKAIRKATEKRCGGRGGDP